MQTRSKTSYDRSVLYEVNIDFDEASEAWKKNKISIGNGSYRYLCTNLDKSGCSCRNKCLRGKDVCSKHNNAWR